MGTWRTLKLLLHWEVRPRLGSFQLHSLVLPLKRGNDSEMQDGKLFTNLSLLIEIGGLGYDMQTVASITSFKGENTGKVQNVNNVHFTIITPQLAYVFSRVRICLKLSFLAFCHLQTAHEYCIQTYVFTSI